MTKEMPLFKCKEIDVNIEDSIECIYEKFDEICDKMDINHGLT